MKRHLIRIVGATFGIASVLGIAGGAAAGGPNYDLSWYSVDGGGGTSTGGDFVLAGVIGQPDAGTITGGDFVLAGGFLAGGAAGGAPPCPGNVNGDGQVDFDDLLDVLGSWGVCPAPCPPDLDGSGIVDFTDLLAVLGAWGPCPG